MAPRAAGGSCGIRSEHGPADELGEVGDVEAAGEFEFDAAEAAEPEFEFAVAVEGSGGLDRPRLDLAVGQRGRVAFLARHALDVHGDDALVGEHDVVANALGGDERLLALDVELAHVRFDGRDGHYDRIDRDALWQTVTRDFPDLRRHVSAALS